MIKESEILEGADRLHAVKIAEGWSIRLSTVTHSIEIGKVSGKEKAERFLSRFPTIESEKNLRAMYGV